MDTSTAIKTVSKAIAGAIVAALVALLARYGFNADESVQSALDFLITTLLGAAAGFIGVYLAPKNKEVK